MAIDLSITITKDALPPITINPPDLDTGAEEDTFLDYTWFTFGPRDGNGDLLTRTNANQGAAIQSWARVWLRTEYKRIVEWRKVREANTARSTVADWSGKAEQ